MVESGASARGSVAPDGRTRGVLPATVLTEVCAPWVVLTVGSVHLGRAVGSTGWGLATAAGLGIVPQAAITWRVRRKALSDHHGIEDGSGAEELLPGISPEELGRLDR